MFGGRRHRGITKHLFTEIPQIGAKRGREFLHSGEIRPASSVWRLMGGVGRVAAGGYFIFSREFFAQTDLCKSELVKNCRYFTHCRFSTQCRHRHLFHRVTYGCFELYQVVSAGSKNCGHVLKGGFIVSVALLWLIATVGQCPLSRGTGKRTNQLHIFRKKPTAGC